jgi:hypothetical protein
MHKTKPLLMWNWGGTQVNMSGGSEESSCRRRQKLKCRRLGYFLCVVKEDPFDKGVFAQRHKGGERRALFGVPNVQQYY